MFNEKQKKKNAELYNRNLFFGKLNKNKKKMFCNLSYMFFDGIDDDLAVFDVLFRQNC